MSVLTYTQLFWEGGGAGIKIYNVSGGMLTLYRCSISLMSGCASTIQQRLGFLHNSLWARFIGSCRQFILWIINSPPFYWAVILQRDVESINKTKVSGWMPLEVILLVIWVMRPFQIAWEEMLVYMRGKSINFMKLKVPPHNTTQIIIHIYISHPKYAVCVVDKIIHFL